MTAPRISIKELDRLHYYKALGAEIDQHWPTISRVLKAGKAVSGNRPTGETMWYELDAAMEAFDE